MNKVVVSPYRLELLDNLHDIDASRWNALAGEDYPFLRHEFLLALEDSGCVGVQQGWMPRHLLVWRGKELVALAPLYLKTHSFGEYVFDWSWADAYHQHGLDYYPKLLSAVPFTPSSGPRLCLAPGEPRQALLAFLVEALRREALELGASGWHLLFPETALSEELEALGMPRRAGCQYQWFNRDYRDFDHFLAGFSSRKRKNLRKERVRLAEAGFRFRYLRGKDIDAHWPRFYRFYANTYLVRGRQPYLNLDFFQRLSASMPDSLLLVLADQGEDCVAGALSFVGADTLYGRYWGCDEDHQFLHFETCYYQGIDFCIAQGLQRFDSGAQGEHKIQRGFEPVTTWSNHWLADPRFQRAIGDFIDEEARYLSRYREHAAEYLPFKQTPAQGGGKEPLAKQRKEDKKES